MTLSLAPWPLATVRDFSSARSLLDALCQDDGLQTFPTGTPGRVQPHRSQTIAALCTGFGLGTTLKL